MICSGLPQLFFVILFLPIPFTASLSLFLRSLLDRVFRRTGFCEDYTTPPPFLREHAEPGYLADTLLIILSLLDRTTRRFLLGKNLRTGWLMSVPN